MKCFKHITDAVKRWLGPVDLHDYEVDVEVNYEFKLTISANTEAEAREMVADELRRYLCEFIKDTKALADLVDTYEMECISIKLIDESDEE